MNENNNYSILNVWLLKEKKSCGKHNIKQIFWSHKPQIDGKIIEKYFFSLMHNMV